ncbi:MAG: 3TM-type holin, partial [bacterium]
MIPALVTTLLPLLGGVIDKVIPDRAAAEKAKLDMQAKLLDAATTGALAQIEVNKTEAGHQSVFVAGWRPAIGWICAAALAYSYMIVPLVGFTLTLMGQPVPRWPVLDGNLWELMFGMLGL